MAVAQALARIPGSLPDDCALAKRVDQLCRDQKHLWRDRLLTPWVTVRLMLLQVLFGNTAITHLRQLSGLSFAAASFCEARGRLPLAVLEKRAERAIRPAVVARKISGGSSSASGADAWATLSSLLRTAGQQRKNVLETIKSMLTAAWATAPPTTTQTRSGRGGR